MVEILKKITDKRQITIDKKGMDFGVDIPEERNVPIVKPNLEEGVIICEIKRGSPSEGMMNEIKDVPSLAAKYIKSGANVISVLTEEDFFYGSLSDFIEVKKQFPGMCFLRKDFIMYKEEIEISYRAGADMILLIAAMFIGKENGQDMLKEFLEESLKFGLTPLLEIHNKQELDFVKPLNAPLLGINSRDLKTFKIDTNYPHALKSLLPNTNVIFESGIKNYSDAFFAGISGFDGLLVGSSIVKSNDVEGKIKEINEGYRKARPQSTAFYAKFFEKIYFGKKPVVKICGITKTEDANIAVSSGADLIGFVLAPSKREVSIKKAKEIASGISGDVLKIGVVTSINVPEVISAVKDGWLDAIQVHGNNINENDLKLLDVPYFRAINVSNESDLDYKSTPFVLFDSFTQGESGGTGKVIDKKLLLKAVEKNIPLYLAGGINPDNVGEIIREFNPVMIDLASGVEKEKGIKDHDKIKKLFDEINRLKK